MAASLTVGKIYRLNPQGMSLSVMVKILEMRNDGWARVVQKPTWVTTADWDKDETWINLNAYVTIDGPYDERGFRAN